MSYKKQMQMKVVRSTHIVTFHCQDSQWNSTAGEIAKDIAQVPSNARLIEIDENNDVYTLKFVEETEAE